MISKESSKQHQKHAKLTNPALGEFARTELAIIGTACANIKTLAGKIINQLTCKVAYVDADHKSEETKANDNTVLNNGAFLEYTDKITFQRIDFKTKPNLFQRRILFNEQGVVLVNGNHFTAKSQVVVVDPIKNLEKKLDQLTDVVLILLKEKDAAVPDFLQNLAGFKTIPVLSYDDETGIIDFVKKFLAQNVPPLQALILSGGQSTRMKMDKGSLSYHGVSQREYLFNLLSNYCQKSFISCNAQQAAELGGALPIIQDSFLQLGPMGGILSAFQTDPNAAWLTVACDLPYLSGKTIEYLVQNRNPAKVATAFLDPNGAFPEPLITIWEPRSYSILLQFLSQGYSCPRKALINSDIELLKAPYEKELLNANSPEDYQDALRNLKTDQV